MKTQRDIQEEATGKAFMAACAATDKPAKHGPTPAELKAKAEAEQSALFKKAADAGRPKPSIARIQTMERPKELAVDIRLEERKTLRRSLLDKNYVDMW